MGRERGLLLAIALVFSLFFVQNAYLCDDAFYSFRTADNLVRGHGLRWNTGERVQVYSNPLHVLAFSGLYWISHDRSPEPNPDRVYWTAMLLSWTVSLLAVSRIAAGTRPAVFFVPFFLLLMSSQAFVSFTSSGLETPWTYLFVALFYQRFLWSRPSTPRDSFWLLLWASLAVVNRLDTALLFLPACVALLVRGFGTHGRRLLPAVALAALPMLAWSIFALAYYGFLLPNSYYAKIGLGVERGVLNEMGMAYFGLALRQDPITPVVIVAGMAASVLDRKALLAGLSVLLYVAYVFRVGGDFIGQRFLAPPFLLSVLVLMRVARTREPAFGRVGLAAAGIAFLLYGALVPSSPMRVLRDGPAVGDVRFYFHASSLARWRPERSFPFAPFLDVADAEACRALRHEGSRTSVRGGAFQAYCRGPDHHSIVPAGIANPLMARLPVRVEVPFLPGHVFKPVPAGYPESFEEGENRIEDEALAAYFDSLRTVTTGPILSWPRWRAIWELNLTASRRYDRTYRAGIVPPLLPMESLVERLRKYDLEDANPR